MRIVTKRCPDCTTCRRSPDGPTYECLEQVQPFPHITNDMRRDLGIAMERIKEQANHYHSHPPDPTQSMASQITREMLDHYQPPRADLKISPILVERINEWCRMDPRVDAFWHYVVSRLRTDRPGLNDEITDALMQALSHLLLNVDKELDTLNTRNLDNIRALGNAGHSVVSAFDDAQARGDLAYLEAAIEELDAALYETKFGKDTE